MKPDTTNTEELATSTYEHITIKLITDKPTLVRSLRTLAVLELRPPDLTIQYKQYTSLLASLNLTLQPQKGNLGLVHKICKEFFIRSERFFHIKEKKLLHLSNVQKIYGDRDSQGIIIGYLRDCRLVIKKDKSRQSITIVSPLLWEISTQLKRG